MDSSSYRPDLDTLNKYFELPPSQFAVPEQRSDATTDDPDTEFQPYLENMLYEEPEGREAIDQNLFQKIGSVLKTNFDQMNWRAPEERISDFYWIVTKYLKATQSLYDGLGNIAEMNRSEPKETMNLFDLLQSASKQNRISIRLKFTLEEGRSATITPPASIENAILSYFEKLKKDMENEAGELSRSPDEKTAELIELIKSLQAKSGFASEARKRQCQQIKTYLGDGAVNIPAEGQKYLIIGSLFDLADQPFYHRDDFDPYNLIEVVRKFMLVTP